VVKNGIKKIPPILRTPVLYYEIHFDKPFLTAWLILAPKTEPLYFVEPPLQQRKLTYYPVGSLYPKLS
jgi:hypothetical protein